jgi:hypothetical protein
MRFLLFGIIALLGLFLVSHLLLRADPKVLARRAKPVGIGLAVALAIVLTLTGRFGLARRLLVGAFAFLGPFSPFGAGGGMSGSGPSPGGRRPGTSRVRTALFEMELDHGTGEMLGRVVAGTFAGRTLEELVPGDFAGLFREAAAAEDQSAAVLAAYLDRRHPDWRADPRFGAAGGGDAGSGSGRRSSAMTRDEALDVLGVEPDASDAEIRRAHRRLMKQVHPDQGGSDYLASKINAAKDVLLKG